jgi:hypothetical protein
MPLYLQGNSLLQKGGKLGTSAGCCCKNALTACDCSGASVSVPKSLTVQVTLGSLVFSSSSCAPADAQSLIEGTYVLPYTGKDSYAVGYGTTLSNGMTLGFAWYCAPIAYYSSAISAMLAIRYCDGGKTCFARFDNDLGFDAPGYPPVFGQSVPTLCNYTQGSTSPFYWNAAPANGFNQGPLICENQANQGNQRYNLAITFTPLW